MNYPRVRNSGTTTAQLKSAPLGSLFICMNYRHKIYVEKLCQYLNREDIAVMTRTVLTSDKVRRLRGTQFSSIIADHSVELEPHEIEGWDYLNTYCIHRNQRQGNTS